MWRVWLLFDPRRTLVALFTFLFALALRDPLHPAQHRPVQLAGRPAPGRDRRARADRRRCPRPRADGRSVPERWRRTRPGHRPDPFAAEGR